MGILSFFPRFCVSRPPPCVASSWLHAQPNECPSCTPYRHWRFGGCRLAVKREPFLTNACADTSSTSFPQGTNPSGDAMPAHQMRVIRAPQTQQPDLEVSLSPSLSSSPYPSPRLCFPIHAYFSHSVARTGDYFRVDLFPRLCLFYFAFKSTALASPLAERVIVPSSTAPLVSLSLLSVLAVSPSPPFSLCVFSFFRLGPNPFQFSSHYRARGESSTAPPRHDADRSPGTITRVSHLVIVIIILAASSWLSYTKKKQQNSQAPSAGQYSVKMSLPDATQPRSQPRKITPCYWQAPHLVRRS